MLWQRKPSAPLKWAKVVLKAALVTGHYLLLMGYSALSEVIAQCVLSLTAARSNNQLEELQDGNKTWLCKTRCFSPLQDRAFITRLGSLPSGEACSAMHQEAGS